MDMRKIAIVPATLALGLFAAHAVKADPASNDGTTTYAAAQGDAGGDGKNGGGDTGGGDGKNGGGDTGGGTGGGDGKNGGGDTGGGDGKNGGGDNGGDGKNGGGDNGGGGKNGGGDNGGGGKNGEGDHSGGGDHHDGGHKHVSYHFNYGTGSGARYRNIRCMVNGHRFWVRVWSECMNMRMAYSGGYSYGGGYVVGGKNGECGQYVTRKRHGRRVRVMVGQPAYQTQGYVGGGYGYSYGQPVIRYYQPASRAAAMQARRRAAKAAASYGYDAGAYGYGAGVVISGGGYGYGGAYATGGGYGYGEGGYVVSKRGKKRLRKGAMVIQPTYIYNPNVVYQSGPIITKDGGY